MAHECPDCYSACCCGGDIDDLLMNGTREEQHCTHCPDDRDEAEPFEPDDDDEELYGFV